MISSGVVTATTHSDSSALTDAIAITPCRVQGLRALEDMGFWEVVGFRV